jgi:putative peptidoglycan lipid II flippase
MASERRNIARAAGVVSALTLVSRVTGLLRDAVVGYFFGAGMAAEAFFVAFRFPNLFRRLVAEGAISVAFVPVFADLLANRSTGEAQRGLRAVLWLAVVALAALSLAGALLAPLWVDIFAPGFADDPALRDLTVRLTRMLFPYLALIGTVAVLAGFLNACRHFTAPALSPAILNVMIIACALALQPLLGTPVEALAFGVLAGGACQVALQIAVLRRRGVALAPLWEPANEAVRRSAALLLPVTFGTAIFQVNVLIGTILASLLPTGSVSYLWYADRVFEFPLGLFVAALGTAALPSMASQAARGELEGMGDSLSFALSLMNLIAVPATVGLILLAEPITAVLFERGAFGAAETAMTARALRAYAVGLWPVAAVRLLAPGFYALGDARTPVYVALLAVLANVVVGVVLMGPVAPHSSPAWLAGLINSVALADLDHAALALATSFAATVNAVCLGALLARRIRTVDRTAVFGSLLRSAVASVPMGLAVHFVTLWWPAGGGLAERVLGLGSAIALGITVFAATALVLGGREVDRARAMVVERLSHRD